MSYINCRYGLWQTELTSIRYAGLIQLVRELYWHTASTNSLRLETVQHVKKDLQLPKFLQPGVTLKELLSHPKKAC